MSVMSNNINNYSLFWKETLVRIRSEISDQEYFTWFNRLEYESSKLNEIVFSIPSKFIQDQIKQRYLIKISEILNELTGSEIKISFVIKKQSATPKTTSLLPDTNEKNSEHKPSPKTKHAFQKKENASNSYSFDTFVVGDNSSFAFNACMAIAKNPGTTYNPCLIYGGVGLGKTHLIQSINNYVNSNIQELDTKYVTAETFTNEFINWVEEWIKKIKPPEEQSLF